MLAQLIVVQLDADTGTDVTFSPASAAGDTFPNNGRTYLYINSQDASQKIVTITSPRECNQGFQHHVVVDIPAGERRLFILVIQYRESGAVDIQNTAVFFGVPSNTTATMDDMYSRDRLKWIAAKYCDMGNIQENELVHHGRLAKFG